MREILFRGQTTVTKRWIYGFYGENSGTGQSYIREKDDCCYVLVIPETIGQYTGLTDKNGTRIFEGDVVKNDWCFACGYSDIKFGQYTTLDMSNEYQQGYLGFYLEHIHEVDKPIVRKDILYFANNCEIIGNIHDNPELLKGGADNG